MNVPLILATLLSFLTLLAHALTGENALLAPIAASDLSPALKALVIILWHGITGFLFMNTLILAVATFRPNHQIVILIAMQYLIFALVFVLVGQIQLGSPFIMPQWIVGFLISVLCFIAIKQKINQHH